MFKVVQTHFESWSSEYSLRHNETLPHYVENDFRSYIKCEILAYGFARAHCPDCRHEFLIAFSCKGRGACVSCNTKYIGQTAAHLIDNVFPVVPIRQFVLSLPKIVRHYLQRNSEFTGKILSIFLQEVERQFRKNIPDVPNNAKLASVTFIQRFGSLPNLHVHFHVIIIEVLFYQSDDGQAYPIQILRIRPGQRSGIYCLKSQLN